jgi:hypothetical protein
VSTAAEQMARKFHETYDRLADEPPTPWEDIPAKERQHLIDTCQEVLDWAFPTRYVLGMPRR